MGSFEGARSLIDKTLIVVSRGNFPQGAWGGNEYEQHRLEWTREKRSAYGESWESGEAILMVMSRHDVTRIPIDLKNLPQTFGGGDFRRAVCISLQ